MDNICTALTNNDNTINFQQEFQGLDSLFLRASHKEKYSFPQVDRKDIKFSDDRTDCQKLISVIRRATGRGAQNDFLSGIMRPASLSGVKYI